MERVYMYLDRVYEGFLKRAKWIVWKNLNKCNQLHAFVCNIVASIKEIFRRLTKYTVYIYLYIRSIYVVFFLVCLFFCLSWSENKIYLPQFVAIERNFKEYCDFFLQTRDISFLSHVSWFIYVFYKENIHLQDMFF